MVFKKHQKAFSLIEISVVIVIIGILIAGVSQGIDLYNEFKLTNARTLTLNSVVPRISNLSMWWETTAENSFKTSKPNDGELINQWNDINPQRAMKINLFNASNGDSRPTYKSSAINGLPALKFSDAQNLRSNDIRGVDFFNTNEMTVFLIQNTTGGSDSTMSWIPTTNNLDAGGAEITRFNLHLLHANQFFFDFGGRVTYSGANAYAKKNTLFTLKRSGATMIMRLNGQEISSDSAVTANTANISNSYVSPFIVGKMRTDSYYHFDGFIAEIIIYGNGLHINEIKKIEAYLAKKWGIKI
jgi:prepilin-type N-terminal cleavage/methylation domain-containing protein